METLTNFSDEMPFLSVIIPAYNRFSYLEELVESLHRHADYPFELIIHDDNSKDGTKEKIFSLNDRVSTVIFNNGLNMGLAESINRMVSIAGSNYILMLNADCRIESGIFKDTVNVLKCPFVGYLSYMTPYTELPRVLENNGTRFSTLRGIGAGCIMSFRKDVWARVGGWNNKSVSSGNADVSFSTRVIKNGYFPVAFIRATLDPQVRNLSQERHRGLDSTIPSEYDCSFPKLFHYDGNSSVLSRRRYEKASNEMQLSYKALEGETNIDFWHKFCCELTNVKFNINWEVAKRYGHIKWKEEVEKRSANLC